MGGTSWLSAVLRGCQSLARCQYLSEMGNARRVASVLALAALSAVIAAGFTWSCAGTSTGSGNAACARAKIAGRVVCLKPNVHCERSHERVYRSYGLTCVLRDDGFRLEQRNFIAPPNP
jgi:hypothetical protein